MDLSRTSPADTLKARGTAGEPVAQRATLFERTGLLAALVFILSLALYTLTLAPGLLWGGNDFAVFQTRAFLGDFTADASPLGHPLWVLLAHLFTLLPIRDIAWRANFAAAVFAAATLAFAFLSARLLTRSNPASLLAAGTLAVSHTFWTYAVTPKVYSLNLLVLAVCVYLLLRWREAAQNRYLYLFAFTYGLGFFNHLMTGAVALGFVAFVGLVLRQRHRSPNVLGVLSLTGLAFALGLAPYLSLALSHSTAQADSTTIGGGLNGLLFTIIHPQMLFKGAAWGMALALYQFPASILVGIVGLYQLWKRDREAAALITLAAFGVTLFVLALVGPLAGLGTAYVWNIHYYIQAYFIFALALAVGFQFLWTRWRSASILPRLAVVALSLALPVLLYAAAPAVARVAWNDVPDFRPASGRDNFTYALSPWKQNETGARPFGEDVLRALPSDSILVADYGPWAVIRYLQVVDGARPDVQLVKLPESGRQAPLLLQHRRSQNLFLVDIYRYYDVDDIQRYFQIVPEGPVYRLVAK